MTPASHIGPRSRIIASVALATVAGVSSLFAAPFMVGSALAGPRAAALAATAPAVANVAKGAKVAKVAKAASLTFPTTPPAPICGDATVLSGPAAAPAGAVTVPSGDNSAIDWNHPGSTFWFAAGTHSLGTEMFSQIMPAANTVFLGAPGAVIDGNGVNRYAFTQTAAGVTIRYLTIQGFVPPLDEGVVNHDSGVRWTIQYNTIQNNAGAAVMVGPGNVVSYNCIRGNGQYGFNAFAARGNTNIDIAHNEITGNDTAKIDLSNPSCGCFGGGKIWSTVGGSITKNWIHDNYGPGIWADTNNAGILIDGNYIADNDNEAIFYEISYNAQITNNNILRNGLVEGRRFVAQNSTFPVGAIYISNSGGDTRAYNGVYSTFAISGNNLVDNWGGLTLWEDANRFCGANSSTRLCTAVNPQANPTTCVSGTIDSSPYVADCRWKTQNVSVHDNQFSFTRANVGCTTVGCGEQAIIANSGTNPDWSPYLGGSVDVAVTTQQNNHFADNTYVGDWSFALADTNQSTFTQWQGSPGYQDAGSTLNGATYPPAEAGNLVDADTASLEGSIGHWVPWFSASVARTTAQAHVGTHSLQVTVKAPNGWGVQSNVWPGVASAPGPQTLAFWAKVGSGALGATLQVQWVDHSGVVLATSHVGIATLTTAWRQARVLVNAPAGTAYASISMSDQGGVAGNTLFLDQVFVGPTQVTGVNLLDPATSGLEASIGHWVPWFSTAVVRVTAQAQSGTHSLRVNINAPNGWGLQLDNAPGYAATAGPKTIGFWGRLGSGSLGATMRVDWLGSTGTVLGTSSVTLATLTASWQMATAKATAPAGTAAASVSFSNSRGVAGNLLYLDQIYVGT